MGPQAVGAFRIRGASWIDHHARRQLQQVLEVAAIHGQAIDDIALQRSAQFRVGGIHHGQRLGDGDRLRLLAGLQHQIHAQFLIGLEQNPQAFDRLESHGLRAHRVGARKQVGTVVLTGLVGGQRSRRASLRVGDRHCGADQHAPALIREGSQNSPRVALRERRTTNQE